MASTVRLVQDLGGIGGYLFMALVGLTVTPGAVRRNAPEIALIGGAAVLAALALAPLGVAAFGSARWHLARGALAPTLIVAAALMANGLPIVAGVLRERGMLRGDLAATVLGVSAVLVVLPFLIVAAVDHRSRSAGSDVDYAVSWAAAAAVAVGLSVIWPRVGPPLGDRAVLTLAVIAVLIGAWLSARLLATGLVGGFAVGVAMSRSGRTRDVLERYLGKVVPTILVPVYFAAAGARVALRVLDPTVLGAAILFTLLLIGVAVLTGLAIAWAPGIGRREARTITALINCRGLVLLALAVSMANDRLIGPSLVMVFFVGALATTLMTGPLLSWADRAARRPRARAA